jgi:RNA polymerase sigma-70 factor (ECF subfamily)
LTLGVPAAPGSKNGQAAQLRTSLAEAKAAGPREPEDLASVPVPGAASNLPGEIQRLAQPSAMLYLRPLKKMGHVLQLQAFDAGYLEALRAGEPRIEEHFVCYFTELLQLKLRSRLRSPQAIEDVRQETFARVLATVRKKDGLRQPERLGPFVNTVCNNVLLEYYRQSSRSDSLDEDGAPELPARGGSVLDAVASKQTEAQVRDVLNGLPEHDRSLLKAVFLDERDRDDVCREFGVDRDYLRVLLHRAKHVFKAEYLKRSGNRLPFTSAAGEA